MPTVSVILPVFGTEAYLTDCLDSLAAQTFQDFEVIVVDDASPGNCETVVRAHAGTLPELRYVRHDVNKGTLQSRFTGVDASRGDYIAFLDPDDTAVPAFLKRLHAAAVDTGADIVASSTRQKEGNQPCRFESPSELMNGYITRDIENFNTWTRLFRRDVLTQRGDLRSELDRFRVDSPEDLLLNLFLAIKGHSLQTIPDVLVDYNRQREDSITNSLDPGFAVVKTMSRLHLKKILHKYGADFRQEIDELVYRSLVYLHQTTYARLDAKQLDIVIRDLVDTPESTALLGDLLSISEQRGRYLREKLVRRDEMIERRNRKISLLQARLEKSSRRWWHRFRRGAPKAT